MTTERKARELLAEEYEKDNCPATAEEIRKMLGPHYLARLPALRAIIRALESAGQGEAQAVPEPPRYHMTTGHCLNKSAGSRDCGLHNLHCNWPKCDQRIELLNPTPPPSAQPEVQAGGAVAEPEIYGEPDPMDADSVPISAADCINWLDAKYRRHGEIEDHAAAEWLRYFTTTTPPPSAVPEGWKLVPVEATPEMVNSVAAIKLRRLFEVAAGKDGRGLEHGIREEWAAMLAAAPAPKEGV